MLLGLCTLPVLEEQDCYVLGAQTRHRSPFRREMKTQQRLCVVLRLSPTFSGVQMAW
jgi:hypothetical protein